MVRQISLFRWNSTASPERVELMKREIAKLPELIPTIARYEFGSSLGLTEGAADFAVVADCATQEDWRAYVEHPVHIETVTKYLYPLMEMRLATQVEV